MEFERDEIDFIASAAHSVLQKHPENSTVNKVIASLIQQTTFVSKDARMHGVGVATANHQTSSQMVGALFMGYDLSYLAMEDY
jgi:hypothetical protein